MKKFWILSFIFILVFCFAGESTNAARITKDPLVAIFATPYCCDVDIDPCITAAANDANTINLCIGTNCVENACIDDEKACSSGEQCTSGICNVTCQAAGGAIPIAPAGGAIPVGPKATAGADYTLPNFLAVDDPSVVIGRVIKFIVGISGSLALVMFIYGGLLWLFSAGRTAYIDKGRDAMIWSGVGLIVIFGSYIAINFVLSLLEK
ncbi:pilin [Patescibacteria group bacterium]|nr:pilin [Patescibacteria group bacterium]